MIDAKEKLHETEMAIAFLRGAKVDVPAEAYEMRDILAQFADCQKLLAELSTCAVEHQEERVSYVTVQIPTLTWEQLQSWREKRKEGA